jgi:hypothetical protein
MHVKVGTAASLPGGIELSATYGEYYNSVDFMLPLPSDTLDLQVEDGIMYSFYAGMHIPADFWAVNSYFGLSFDYLNCYSSDSTIAFPFAGSTENWRLKPGYHAWGLCFKAIRSFFWNVRFFGRAGASWASGIVFQDKSEETSSFPYGRETYLKGNGLCYSLGGGLEFIIPFTERVRLPEIPLMVEIRKNWITVNDFDNPHGIDVPDEINMGGYMLSAGLGIRFL